LLESTSVEKKRQMGLLMLDEEVEAAMEEEEDAPA